MVLEIKKTFKGLRRLNMSNYLNSCFHFIIIVIITISSIIQAQTTYPTKINKKVILYGGYNNHVGPAWVKSNLAKVEALPFDGIVLNTGNAPGADAVDVFFLFNPYWSSLDSVSLQGVKWSHCKYNMFEVWTDDNAGMSYFNDSQWDKILANTRKVARAAKAANFAGVLLDTEPYSQLSPWDQRKKLDGHSETELRAKIRLRGGQFMAALQKELPNIVVLTPYFFSWAPDPDWMGRSWALLPDWCNGMLDSIKGDARLIEGDEYTYYLTNTSDWFGRYSFDRLDLRKYAKPENASKYDKYVQVGKSTFSQHISGAKEWEHNHYMGMMTTDEYVWAFLPGTPFFHSPTPTDVDQAIRSAMKKYNNGERLGFDMVGSNFPSAVNVNITSPANGTKVASKATVKVTVTATGVSTVTLYKNVLAGSVDASVPFEWTFSNLPDGEYTFVARAKNNSGEWGTSNPVNVIIGNPGPNVMRSNLIPMMTPNISIKKSFDDLWVYVPFSGNHKLQITDVFGRQLASIYTSGTAKWYEMSSNMSRIGSGVQIINLKTDNGCYYTNRSYVLR